MSDALPLPPRPNIEQYKKLAKDLQQVIRSAGPGAIRDWAARWVETLARLQGREIGGDIQSIERRWETLHKPGGPAPHGTLSEAQLFVARCHGFTSWPKFAKHLKDLARANSPVSQFEQAADAIVNGDLPALQHLLKANPALVRARSPREDRSTLLHYVSANGIEDYRQKTPPNIVAIAKLLLDSGAGVNAESDAYGGRSTTMGLTATSYHPEAAGAQIPLMELLLAYGAIIEGPDRWSAVNGCLHNGRGEAAAFLAARGARLDLEGAAGVGRLDVVKTFVNEDGSLRPPATADQLQDAFAWACQFGHTAVADFLSSHSALLDTRLGRHGQTGLHWAAYGGHADTVKLLLVRGASVAARDENFGGTPLGWAIYAWTSQSAPRPRADYYAVVALLVKAGAALDPGWCEEDGEERRGAIRKLRADPRMQAALSGE